MDVRQKKWEIELVYEMKMYFSIVSYFELNSICDEPV